MMIAKRPMLGLSFSADSVRIVELRAVGGKPSLSAAATLPLPLSIPASSHAPATDQPPDQVRVDDVQAVGAALRGLLKKHRFRAKRGVIALGGASLLTSRVTLPPCNTAAAQGVIRIRAEQQFPAATGQSFIFDYIGQPSGDRNHDVLLVAVRREALERAMAIARAAGIEIEAVVPGPLALPALSAQAMMDRGGDSNSDALRTGIVTNISTHGADLVAQGVDGPAMSRHVPLGNSPDDRVVRTLMEELRRARPLLLASGQNGAAQADETGKTSETMVVVDGRGLSDEAAESLRRDSSFHVRFLRTWKEMGIEPNGAAQKDPIAAEAAGAALIALRAAPMPCDLLHPRLAEPTTTTTNRKPIFAGIALAAVIVLVVGALAVRWTLHHRAVSVLESRLQDISAPLASATAVRDRVQLARSWFDRRPSTLDILREVTLRFPQEPTVWATNIVIEHDGRCSLTGSASTRQPAIDLLKALQDCDQLAQVKMAYLQESSRESSRFGFQITFTCVTQP